MAEKTITPQEETFDAETRTKVCTECLERRPYSSYVKSKSKIDGLSRSCKPCGQDYFQKNKDRVRNSSLKLDQT